MADKKKGHNISFRINLSKLDPKHYYFDEKTGEYHGDFRMTLYEEDRKTVYNGKEYTDNGFVSQQLNDETRKAEKELPNEQKTKTPILGNVKWWKGQGNPVSMPGYTGAVAANVPGAASSGVPGVPGLSGPVVQNGEAPKESLPF